MRLFALAAAGVLVLTAGCGGSSQEAAPSLSPSPSVTPDQWAIKMCDYLAGQDPTNGYALELAVTHARQSTLPDLVELAGQAERASSQNLLRGWCQKHVPSSGVTPAAPQ